MAAARQSVLKRLPQAESWLQAGLRPSMFRLRSVGLKFSLLFQQGQKLFQWLGPMQIEALGLVDPQLGKRRQFLRVSTPSAIKMAVDLAGELHQ